MTTWHVHSAESKRSKGANMTQQEAQGARKRPYDYDQAPDGTYHVLNTYDANGFLREGVRLAVVARLIAWTANRRKRAT